MSNLFSVVSAQEPAPGQDCKIAFIGDFPDDHDRLHGFPLVGPVGKVFDQILRVAGLAVEGTNFPVPAHARKVRNLLNARAPFFVTQVFDCAVPDNDLSKWCSPIAEAKEWKNYGLSKLGRFGYLKPEFAIPHLYRLQRELDLWKPNLIVPLGPTALWALTGQADINIARGAITQASFLIPGAKILPTYHPAAVMKDWRLFHVVVADLMKAAIEAEFPELRLVKREIYLRPTVEDLVGWQRSLLGSKSLAVDIETSKQQITCIGFSPSPDKAFVVPFVDYEQSSRSYWPTVEAEVVAWQMVREVCESPVPKILQNGLYDGYYLIRQAGIWLRNYCEDTRLQHHSLYPELPKSLAFLGATYANQGPWKQMRIKAREKRDD